MLRKLTTCKGFTLIELMVVVVIIGILVAVAVPIYSNMMDKTKTKTCQANVRIIEGAANQYKLKNGTYPATMNDLITSYITTEPSCPSGGHYTYTSDTGKVDCDIVGH